MFFYSIGSGLFFGEFVPVMDYLFWSKAALTEAFTVVFAAIGF